MTRGNHYLTLVPPQRPLPPRMRRDLSQATSWGQAPWDGRRIALYSHDTQGLGHVRRNTMLAAAMVAADPEAEVLLICGARDASELPLPERTGLVILPELSKDALGCYSARAPGVLLDEVIAVRTRVLKRLLTAYAPHLLVVDKVSRGFGGELEPALRHVRAQHGARIVLGLRDVLDDPGTSRREWEESRTPEAIQTLYDQVWVYGDPTIFDPVVEYGWSAAVSAKVRFTGYLGSDRERILPVGTGSVAAPTTSPGLRAPFVLGLIGGGQDGAALADAFARATFPPGHEGVLVTGPYLPEPELERLMMVARGRDALRVRRFVSDVPALARASRATVSMGGYNSVCELMAGGRPTLIVPRMTPRREQIMRAEQFERHGLLDVLSLQDLRPDLLTQWLSEAVLRPDRPCPPVDLRGLGRVPELVSELLSTGVRRGVRSVG